MRLANLFIWFLTLEKVRTQSANKYLKNQWPFTGGTLNDAIGGMNMIQGFNTSFVSDRYGVANSALSLNGGWTYLNAGVYFSTPQFSISLWIYPSQPAQWARIIDFANGPNQNNIVLNIGDSANDYLVNMQICPPPSTVYAFPSMTALTKNQWQFLVITFDGSNVSIYINGTKTGTKAFSYTMPSLLRSYNYFGKDNWSGTSVSSSYFDDIRFYNISLSQVQVQEIMYTDDTTYNHTTVNTSISASLS